MEVNKTNINEMYQYTTTGNTLYDCLGAQINLADFSAESILNSLRRDINLQQFIGDPQKVAGFSNIYNNDIHGRIVDSMLANTTPNEKEELLEKLRSVNPELYNFPGLLEYIGFLKDVNFTRRAIITPEDNEKNPVLNEDIDKLNEILVNTAVKKADPELVSRMRKTLVQLMLIPVARKKIRRDETLDESTREAELHKLKLLDRIYSKPELIEEYDNLVAITKEKEMTAMEAIKLKIACRLTRAAAMSELTGKTVPELMKAADSADGNILELLTPPSTEMPKEPYIPQEGDYAWRYVPDKIPSVILADTAHFSEDGKKDQEIIVVSHGDIRYGRNLGGTKFEEAPLRLIGVTTLGEDGNRNAFLVTPDSVIVKLRNGIDLEQYKKVLLSDLVLDRAVSSGYRYLPEISINPEGIASLNYDSGISLVDSRPENAVKYANSFKGSIGRTVPSTTLLELCNSQALFESQMKVINEVRYKEQSETDRGDR